MEGVRKNYSHAKHRTGPYLLPSYTFPSPHGLLNFSLYLLEIARLVMAVASNIHLSHLAIYIWIL